MLQLSQPAEQIIANLGHKAKTQPTEYNNIQAIGPMLDRVYSMRYRSYSAEEYIDKCSSEKFIDEYDPMPNCKSYLTYSKKKAIGSIRACIYDPEKENRIPVMDVFDDELRENVGYDDIMIEANKFVIDPSYQKKGGVRARFSIYRNIADSIVENNAKYLVAGIRTEHIKFYKMLNFDLASDIREYPHLNFKTVLVVCENVDAFCEKIFSKTQPRMKKLEIADGALFSNSNY